MHEMALAESVLQIVRDCAREQGARAVRSVRLEIGALASVQADALRFCFDAVVKGSLAEGARLDIDATPGAAWCFDCAAAVPVATLAALCPRCGGAQLQVAAGDEMRVKEIEVI
jgi:hydrogenase nickel incorporation protein HypA/HybF